MKFLKALLLLAIVSLGEIPNSWAMLDSQVEENGEDNRELRKRKKPSSSLKRELLPQIAPKKHCIHKHATVAQTSAVSSSSSLRRTLFTQFKEILASEPCPLQEMREITASQEDQEGSRKWVKFFSDPADKETHEWHQKMPKIMVALRQQNERGRYFPAEINFAVARLVFVLEDENCKIVDIPYFFASGWPANANRNSARKFAKALTEERLGEELKAYKNYGLKFITKSYNGEEEKELRSSTYDPFKDEIKKIMREELETEDSIPAENRLQTHFKIMDGDHPGILAKLYFHSEQSIWMTAKSEISKFKESLKKRSKGDIRSHFSKAEGQAQVDPIRHVFVDICSFYDMCWCCGDTLASCCHTLTLEAQTYIRASGCSAYYDMPFEVSPPYALRHHRKEFSGYEEGRSFQMPVQGDGNSLYQPYIAHSVASDFQ